MLVEVGKILAEGLTEAFELLGAFVRAAELHGVLGSLVVHVLQAVAGLEHVQDQLVSVPEEAEVHVDIAVLTLLARVALLNGSQENRLWRLHLVEVSQIRHLLHVHLTLGLVHLLLSSDAELLDNILERANVRCLAHSAVLVQSLPGEPHLLQFHAELKVLNHDELAGGGPLALQLAVLNGLVEHLQGIVLLLHIDEGLGFQQGRLRLHIRRHVGAPLPSSDWIGGSR
mmetsp:Transcript_33206/g.93335  ORF Transcript_33206/g.93335 Transcript_33206/m.93335 type:complete len:228 (-) Transcript_33206:42-725(-)